MLSGCAVFNFVLETLKFPGYHISRCSPTDSAANWGAPSMSLTSYFIAEAFPSPCFSTNSSRRCFRRPTAVTLTPDWIRRSAIALPIPEVAPMSRTCLYGNTILRWDWPRQTYSRNRVLDLSWWAVIRTHLDCWTHQAVCIYAGWENPAVFKYIKSSKLSQRIADVIC